MSVDNIDELSLEFMRRCRLAQIGNDGLDREGLEERYGRVWSTAELCRDFEVHGFAAPFVSVTRRSDGAKGSLEFSHSPRFYWGFVKD